MKRSSFVKSLLSLPVISAGSCQNAGSGKPHVAVVGAGAFGGWTALNLLCKGARVTLIEAREAGNPLASSGGETRVIRHAYEQRIYVDMAHRSLDLWMEHDRRWGTELFQQKGVLFMGRERNFIDAAQSHMEAAGVDIEILDAAEIARRYPQMNSDGLRWAVYEPTAGYLKARMACGAVRDAFIAEGGEYRLASVTPGAISGGEMSDLRLDGGGTVRADRYVFACGPWLKEMFPDVAGELMAITRQELYFFQTPEEQMTALNRDMPVWAEVDDPFWYGIPGRGGVFKLGDDTRGPEVDPTTQSREPTPSGIESARRYMEHRFPGMAGAPLAGSRVCQYCETRDYNFIVDRHPDAENAWLIGGGSGHGFKHGPALGEMAASQVMGEMPVEALFALHRFRG